MAATPEDRRYSGKLSRQPVRGTLTLLLSGVVAGLLFSQRRRLAGLPHLLTQASFGWVALGICAQVISIGTLAREQHRLINVGGGRRPLQSVLATTWAGNAISISVPVVGPAAAAVFVYKRFTTIGVDRAAAAWTLTMSGVYSAVSFAGITGVITVGVGILPLCLGFVGLRKPGVRALAIRSSAAGLRLCQRLFDRPKGHAEEISSAALDRLTSLRLGPKAAAIAGSLAVMNWMLDLACLVCAIHAVHGEVPWHGIILAWAAGTGAGWLGLTPGGLGVVEIALGAALLGAGLPGETAIAAALLYRAIKLGLVLAVGGITLFVIRRASASRRLTNHPRYQAIAGGRPNSTVIDQPDNNVRPTKGTPQ